MKDGRITEHLWAPLVRSRIEKDDAHYSPSDGLVESAASVLPDAVKVPEWVVIGNGSHAMPNGTYLAAAASPRGRTIPERKSSSPKAEAKS